MCHYFLIPKNTDFDNDIREKFKLIENIGYYVNDDHYSVEDQFKRKRIEEARQEIKEEIGDDYFSLIVHFGGMTDYSSFCRAITIWKEAMNTDKLKTILPISSNNKAGLANDLYKKINSGFDNLAVLKLDYFKNEWDKEFTGTAKIEIISEFQDLNLAIRRAELLIGQDEMQDLEKVKEEIIKKSQYIKSFVENVNDKIKILIGQLDYNELKQEVDEIIGFVDLFLEKPKSNTSQNVGERILKLREKLLGV